MYINIGLVITIFLNFGKAIYIYIYVLIQYLYTYINIGLVATIFLNFKGYMCVMGTATGINR